MSWGAAPQGPLPPNEDIHWVVDVVAWIGSGIATILVACRLFTRYHVTRAADWCDWLLGISAILGIVATALQSVAGNYGAGRHIYYLTTEQITKASLYGTVAVPFGQMAMSLPKVATAVVLLRIAGPTAGRRTKAYFYGITGLLCALSTLYCVVLFVQCTPVFALWTSAPEAKCWPGTVIEVCGIVTSTWSAFVDLNLAAYPVAIMRKLQMERRRKAGVCVLMGLGVSATVCAGFKIPHLRDQVGADVTYRIVPLTCLTLSEMNLILISASLPMLRPLWLWLRGRPAYATSSAPGSGGRATTLGSRRGLLRLESRRKVFKGDKSISAGYDERSMRTPSPQPMKSDIKVESQVVISHESIWGKGDLA